MGEAGRGRTGRWVTRAAVIGCVLIAVAMVTAFALNPLGVSSHDPRERIFGIGIYRIPGSSMAPTLKPGEILLVRAGARAAASAQRGDIVTFRPPHHPDQRWVKRLVGLPGETIELHAGRLLLDGKEFAEPYVAPQNAGMSYSRDFGPVRVPRGHVFLLGDNRDNSEDSRYWGPAPRTALHGRLIR